MHVAWLTVTIIYVPMGGAYCADGTISGGVVGSGRWAWPYSWSHVDGIIVLKLTRSWKIRWKNVQPRHRLDKTHPDTDLRNVGYDLIGNLLYVQHWEVRRWAPMGTRHQSHGCRLTNRKFAWKKTYSERHGLTFTEYEFALVETWKGWLKWDLSWLHATWIFSRVLVRKAQIYTMKAELF